MGYENLQERRRFYSPGSLFHVTRVFLRPDFYHDLKGTLTWLLDAAHRGFCFTGWGPAVTLLHKNHSLDYYICIFIAMLCCGQWCFREHHWNKASTICFPARLQAAQKSQSKCVRNYRCEAQVIVKPPVPARPGFSALCRSRAFCPSEAQGAEFHSFRVLRAGVVVRTLSCKNRGP